MTAPALFLPARDDDELAARRETIRQGRCPICGAGPYKVILTHVSKKHGIERREMRELCGLTYTESVCDEEVSKAARERWLSRPELDPRRRERRRKPPLSPEALRRATETITQWAAEHPEEHRRAARAASTKGKETQWGHLPPHLCQECHVEVPRPWVRCKACRAQQQQRRERVGVRALDLWAQGKTDREIGEALGISRRVANKIRRRAQQQLGVGS